MDHRTDHGSSRSRRSHGVSGPDAGPLNGHMGAAIDGFISFATVHDGGHGAAPGFISFPPLRHVQPPCK